VADAARHRGMPCSSNRASRPQAPERPPVQRRVMQAGRFRPSPHIRPPPACLHTRGGHSLVQGTGDPPRSESVLYRRGLVVNRMYARRDGTGRRALQWRQRDRFVVPNLPGAGHTGHVYLAGRRLSEKLQPAVPSVEGAAHLEILWPSWC